MRGIRSLLVLGLAIGVWPSTAAAGPKKAVPKGAVVQGDLGKRLDEAVRSAGGESLWGAVLVAKGGEVLLAQGYGFADYEARANTPSTLFEIASTSKQVTATAILRLEQQKDLATSDSIARFFSGIPADKKKVTVQHLLNHTSGLDPSLGVPYAWVGSRDRYVEEMLESPLVSEPGKAFQYLNVGYALLAAVVEVASRRSFEDYCRKELFAPAGLADTGFIEDEALVESDRVSSRRCDDCLPEWTAARWHWGWGYRGMGGVVTTAWDLLAWDRALRGNAILGEAAREKLYAPALGGYACGWKVETTEHGTRRVHHSGGVRGYACQVARWLEHDVLVVILSNGKSGLFAVEAAIRRLLFAPPRVEVEIDAGARPLGPHRAVTTTDGSRFEVRKEGALVVLRLLWGADALASIRLPEAYARKVADDLESAIAGRDDVDAAPAAHAGIYLGKYAGAKRVKVEESVAVRVLPRYNPGAPTEEDRVVFLVEDGEKRFWPVMAKMNGAAAKALLDALRRVGR